MDEMALAETIEAAQRGEPGAFDRLVDAYARRLHGFLYRLTGSRQETEDLLQEVFLRLVRNIASYAHDGRFEAWLFRIAANLVRDGVRRKQRAPTLIVRAGKDNGDGATDAVDEIEGSEPMADAGLMHGEAVDALNVALGQLSEAEREVVMMRHYSQMSFKEIAAATGVPLGTALARGHRGLEKLRNIMEAADADDGTARFGNHHPQKGLRV